MPDEPPVRTDRWQYNRTAMRDMTTLRIENRQLRRVADMGLYLLRRADKEKLTQVAGSMTYTLVLGLVPFMAVVLAVFTKLPAFRLLEKTLEIYLAKHVIPPVISRKLMNYLALFAEKASHVSVIGALAMLATTGMIFRMIETTFDQIWGVRESRPLAKCVVIYICIALLGPFLIGVSLYMSSHLYLAGRGVVRHMAYLQGAWAVIFLASTSAVTFTLLYRFVPNRDVMWRDAFVGGLFSAILFEMIKRLFAFFIMQFTAYQKIYGALAIFPIFLVWLYTSLLVILVGALLTSSLPDIRSGRWQHIAVPGSQFDDALRLIYAFFLARARQTPIDWYYLQRTSGIGNAEMEHMLHIMQELQWVSCISGKRKWSGIKKQYKHARNRWEWMGDATRIRLADIYHHFVYRAEGNDAVSARITHAIEGSLFQPLADHFGGLAAAEDSKNDAVSAPVKSGQIQKEAGT
ncbi:MAG: YihY family inner membrane protein [Burkholderiaceae bacterium]|jgi:membrane protein|nr:YihY family inner membrane protein [Burkholderiaceae bacterium]